MKDDELHSSDMNVQAALNVKQMAELGWFDVEYTMYGCAYLNQSGKMCYRVSAEEDDIYDFIEKSTRENIYPSNLESITRKYPVPSGMKELLANEVKKELAKELRKKYPKQFFEILYSLADMIRSDHAKNILWTKTDQLEGKFEESTLNRFEDMIHYSYSCLKLTQQEYKELLNWVEEEKKNMDDNFISKDVFEKTMYGICYLEHGAVKYLSNAQRGYIYRMACKFEETGKDVGEIYAKTYWYNNYSYRLPDVIRDYKENLQQICNLEYMQQIQRIKGTVDTDKKEVFLLKLADLKRNGSESAVNTMLRYGKRWGVL